jgi:energy-coupling factor transporter ATP-binding protein EcfA2
MCQTVLVYIGDCKIEFGRLFNYFEPEEKVMPIATIARTTRWRLKIHCLKRISLVLDNATHLFAMKLSKIHIKNYKALRDVEIPLSNFVCLTGENNAGKSSVLQALSLFISPLRLDSHHFFDATEDITITVSFSHISSGDLARFPSENRQRIAELVENGKLELTRRFPPKGDPQIGYFTLLPKDPVYDLDALGESLRGKRAAEISKTLSSLFPDRTIPTSITTQKAAKALVEQWGSELPQSEKEVRFKASPTGAGFSVDPLFPDDIYIPAVKDLKDDASSKQGSHFGKILTILMGKIESKLQEEVELFAKLRERLTRVDSADGILDKRMPEIKEIELMLQGYVRESFANIDLELDIPPPELKTILSTARIFVNDGTKGPLDFKGDGLRRAVVFAILRTYVELASKKPYIEPSPDENTPPTVQPTDRGYVLMFEEPELFLHPDAQRVLFDALNIFSKEHHVIVTTHSPIFLGPGSATFVRMGKTTAEKIVKPFTSVAPVDLSEFAPKDEFQLICFENNNAALFAKKVVLVEGDSEVIVFPHIATCLNSDWSNAKHSIAFVQAKGKGSIQRYRSFFRRFDMPTNVIADLDVILNGFDKLDPNPEQSEMRSKLLQLIDRELPEDSPEPSGKQVKDAHGKGDLKALWNKARETKKKYDWGEGDLNSVEAAIDEFFAWEKKEGRFACLQNPPNAEIAKLLVNLLDSLRSSGVFVLRRGAIEDYYPKEGITGADKPSKAQSYRNVVVTREEIIASSGPTLKISDTTEISELEMICRDIFTFKNSD